MITAPICETCGVTAEKGSAGSVAFWGCPCCFDIVTAWPDGSPMGPIVKGLHAKRMRVENFLYGDHAGRYEYQLAEGLSAAKLAKRLGVPGRFDPLGMTDDQADVALLIIGKIRAERRCRRRA